MLPLQTEWYPGEGQGLNEEKETTQETAKGSRKDEEEVPDAQRGCTKMMEKAKGVKRKSRNEKLERRRSPSVAKLKDVGSLGTNMETNRGETGTKTL